MRFQSAKNLFNLLAFFKNQKRKKERKRKTHLSPLSEDCIENDADHIIDVVNFYKTHYYFLSFRNIDEHSTQMVEDTLLKSVGKVLLLTD